MSNALKSSKSINEAAIMVDPLAAFAVN